MSEMDYQEIRKVVENELRLQLNDEVRKRKEWEEKYYKLYEELQEKELELEQLMGVQGDLNWEWDTGDLSFFQYMERRKIYKTRERELLSKDKEYWNPVFDPKYYAENNPDVVAKVGTDEKALLQHFICVGLLQGKRGNEDFDVKRYLTYNKDVAEFCKMDRRLAYIHYIEYGQKEDRRK